VWIEITTEWTAWILVPLPTRKAGHPKPPECHNKVGANWQLQTREAPRRDSGLPSGFG